MTLHGNLERIFFGGFARTLFVPTLFKWFRGVPLSVAHFLLYVETGWHVVLPPSPPHRGPAFQGRTNIRPDHGPDGPWTFGQDTDSIRVTGRDAG